MCACTHTQAYMCTHMGYILHPFLHCLHKEEINSSGASDSFPSSSSGFRLISVSASFLCVFFLFPKNNKFTLTRHKLRWPEAKVAEVKLHPRALAVVLCIKMSRLWSQALIVSWRKAPGQSLSLPQTSCTILGKSFSSLFLSSTTEK